MWWYMPLNPSTQNIEGGDMVHIVFFWVSQGYTTKSTSENILKLNFVYQMFKDLAYNCLGKISS